MWEQTGVKSVAFYIVLYICGLVPGLYAAVEVSTTTPIVSVVNGSKAVLDCQVNNLGSNTVVWKFIGHNITISTGKDIRVTTSRNKYELVQPLDSNSLVHWNLVIHDVQSSDTGTYMCFVNGTDPVASITSSLSLSSIGVPPTPRVDNIDVTECCKERNVDPCALPLCNTGTNILTLFSILQNGSCIDSELLDILTCAQDGRNHMGCCMRRNVAPLCLDLCDGRPQANDSDYRSCINTDSLRLVECLKEGHAFLPSQPQAVSAVAMSEAVLVTWQKPLENQNKITGYRVQFRKKGTVHFNSTDVTTRLLHTITQLEENTVYEVRVIAVAGAGSSQPSYVIDIATGEAATQNLSKTIYDCCVSKNVSNDCQAYCNAMSFRTIAHPDSILKCQSEIQTIYSCLGGDGDHKPCCERVQVPELCHPLCQGHLLRSWNLTQCLIHMPLISACMMEGSMFLPSPPVNTHVVGGSVTATTIVIEWGKPDDFKPGQYFVVSWKLDKTVSLKWHSVKVLVGTIHQLTDLEPGSVYDIVVSTVNDKGSSLPELTLVVVTEGVQPEPEPAPYNETECCVQKNVPLECLDICNHTFRLSDNAIMKGLACGLHVLSMLECAADGRDHTQCCLDKGITAPCIGLCNPSMSVSTSFLGCFTQKDDLSICFDEGKAILPKSPANVTIKKLETNAILVNWEAPTGPNTTSYLLEYTATTYLPWVKKTSMETFMNVDSLEPNTRYYFRVSSVNANGTSLPSSTILAYTLPVVVGPPPVINWTAVWHNRSDCCSKTVSSPCQALCGNSENMDSTSCMGELDKIIACATDGRNHSDCCSRSPLFPEACLLYCQGQTPPRDATAALCMGYVGSMFTCFTEGKGLLPTPPTRVHVTRFTHETVVLAWEAPSTNCGGNDCEYTAMIWQEGREDSIKRFKGLTVKSKTFTSLLPQTKYYVTVISSNNNGNSLPAPSVIVTTQSDPTFSVMVSQYPPGIIDSGANVQLQCVATGSPIGVAWKRFDKMVSGNHTYPIVNVQKESSGIYTCYVRYDTRTDSKDLRLNVKYKPKGVNITEDNVLPGVFLDAKLTCEFDGFPDIVDWTRDDQALQGITKYRFEALDKQLGSGKTSSTLWVRDVVDKDYGTYTCTGKNKFGSQTISGKLRNLYPTQEPRPSVPTSDDKSTCCREQGIPEDCIPNICTYSIDLAAVTSNPRLGKCIQYIEGYITCGTDGKNHEKCCVEAGVAAYCLPICSGRIPKFNQTWELATCLAHADTMMNCIVDGQKYIPSSPQNVKAVINYDEVKIIWDPPKTNPDKVHLYEAYYTTKEMKPQHGAVSKSMQSYNIPVVKKGLTYMVWVVAVNDFGRSANSTIGQITVDKLTPTEPQNFRGQVDGIFISLFWDLPLSDVRIRGYTVTFRPFIPKGDEVSVKTTFTSIRLENLNENTKYQISVTALGADGPGKVSNVIYVKTGKSSFTGVPDKQSGSDSSNNNTTGLAVGLVFAVVFLIAVAIVAVLMYRRLARKNLGHEISDTVAFENPSYSRGNQDNKDPRISGLPGDPSQPLDADNNQFGYDHLHEEQDMDHGYQTIQPPIGNQTDTPATLDLNNQGSYT